MPAAPVWHDAPANEMYACWRSARKKNFLQKCTRRGNTKFAARATTLARDLGEESANQSGIRNAADAKNVSACAHVRAMLARHLMHFLKRAPHHYFEFQSSLPPPARRNFADPAPTRSS